MKNKSKINLNQVKSNKNNRNLSAINISSNPKNSGKKVNNNLFLGSNKISLKKLIKIIKKLDYMISLTKTVIIYLKKLGKNHIKKI